MPEKYRVNYTRRAANELQEIFDFIERDSPQNAAGMIGRVIDAIDNLDFLPLRYALARNQESIDEEIRSMPVRPYLVLYHIDEPRKTVTILSVRQWCARAGAQIAFCRQSVRASFDF